MARKTARIARTTSRRKRIAAVAVAAAMVVGGGGAAFAYWTASGSGVGIATTGTSVALTVTSSAPTGGPLSPGGPSQTVAFEVTNPGSGTQTLTSIAVFVAEANGDPWLDVTGCSAGDYSFGSAVIDYGPIAAGDSVSGTVTISMVETGANQDACQDIDVPLYFTAG